MQLFKWQSTFFFFLLQKTDVHCTCGLSERLRSTERITNQHHEPYYCITCARTFGRSYTNKRYHLFKYAFPANSNDDDHLLFLLRFDGNCYCVLLLSTKPAAEFTLDVLGKGLCWFSSPLMADWLCVASVDSTQQVVHLVFLSLFVHSVKFSAGMLISCLGLVLCQNFYPPPPHQKMSFPVGASLVVLPACCFLFCLVFELFKLSPVAIKIMILCEVFFLFVFFCVLVVPLQHCVIQQI